MLGCQTATVAYAYSGNQIMKNAVKYLGDNNYDYEDHDKDHDEDHDEDYGKKEQNIKKYFNPLLFTKVRDGKVELTISLVNTSGRSQTISLLNKPYDIIIKNSKGKVIREYNYTSTGTAKKTETKLKHGRSKTIQYVETWDLLNSNGIVVEPGKYRAEVKWKITMNGRLYNISVDKSFTVHKNNIEGLKPSPTPEVQQNVFVTLNTTKKDGKLNIDFALENRTSQDITLQFSSGKKYDIIISNMDGKEVYRLSNGRMYTKALTSKVIEDWSRWTINEVWDFTDNNGKKVAPGKYKIKVEFVSYNYTQLRGIDIKLDAEKQVDVTDMDVRQNIDVTLNTRMVNRKLEMDFALWNNTTNDITLHFGSGLQYDVIITNENNQEVYRWSDGRDFTMALVDKVLEDGTKWSFNDVWNLKDKNGTMVAPGEYKVKVVFVAYDYTNPSGIKVNLEAEKLINITGLDVNKYVAVTMKPEVKYGNLEIPFSLVNLSGIPLDITFYTSQKYDVIIKDKNNIEVYRWSDNRSFLQYASTFTLENGKSFDEVVVWDMKDKLGRIVPKGIYTIEAGFKGSLTNLYVSYNTSELLTRQKF